ncbi:ATP-binding protein [Glycomyces sp. NPDC048151]|uniref:sensor histidine kinase n=1 Tax=Glycomyces sp. NPDC048151 TaxID=3364002 RepID=UPI00371090D8
MRFARIPAAIVGLLVLGYGVLWLRPSPAAHVIGVGTVGLLLTAVAFWWPVLRRFLPGIGLLAAAGSLASTLLVRAAFPGGQPEPGGSTGVWMLVESAALALAVYLVVRWSGRVPMAVTAVAPAFASALVWQRFALEGSAIQVAAVSLFWLLPSVGAASVAAYLRWLDYGRRRAVVDARREQRLDLANDLHDFVAHDISEIVAQAQAGRFVFGEGRPEIAKLLERIETAGVRALGSMDRTLALLRDPGEAARAPVGGVDDLGALVERFNAGGGPQAVLDLRQSQPVSRESGAVVHRAVTEALTNVRRHAPTAATVSIELSEVDGLLRLRIEDDGQGSPKPAARDSSGLGLAGMAERAESLGGSFEAGPREPAGWRITLCLPLQDNEIGVPL